MAPFRSFATLGPSTSSKGYMSFETCWVYVDEIYGLIELTLQGLPVWIFDCQLSSFR